MRRSLTATALLGALMIVTACASARRPGQDDAGAPDDAGLATARSSAALVSASGRVHAGSTTMDVEIGHWLDRRTTRAGARTLEGAAVVNP